MKLTLNERLKRMLAEINPKAYEAIYSTARHSTPQHCAPQHNTTSTLTERLAKTQPTLKRRPSPGERQA